MFRGPPFCVDDVEAPVEAGPDEAPPKDGPAVVLDGVALDDVELGDVDPDDVVPEVPVTGDVGTTVLGGVGAIVYALHTAIITGPLNVVGPAPVTNREFTKTLGKVLGRPTFFPMPAFAARLAFGEMADELLLGSDRVEPKKLLESGYAFKHADLETALRRVLMRS